MMRIFWIELSEVRQKRLRESMSCKRHPDVIFEEWDGNVSHVIKGRARSQFAENGVVFECSKCIEDVECISTASTYYYCKNCGMVVGVPNVRRPESAQEQYKYFGFCSGSIYGCYLCGGIVSLSEFGK